VKRRPTWLTIELTDELPSGDTNAIGDGESTFTDEAADAGSAGAAVAVAINGAAAPPLPPARSYMVDVPWSAWCRLALCGPLVSQRAPPRGSAQLARVLAHHGVCFTRDRYGQRRAFLDLGPRARRAAGAKAVLSFRAHPDDDDDDEDDAAADNNNNNNSNSGSSLGHDSRYSRDSPQRPPSPKSPKEAEWAPLQIEATVRAGGDELWVAATYEATNETLTTRVPGATWRQWLENAVQQAATQAADAAAAAHPEGGDGEGALEAFGATPPFPLGGPPLSSSSVEAEAGTNAMLVAAVQPNSLGVDATPLTAAQVECLQDRLCAALRVLNDGDESAENE